MLFFILVWEEGVQICHMDFVFFEAPVVRNWCDISPCLSLRRSQKKMQKSFIFQILEKHGLMGWWGESAAHPLCAVETSDSSALLHTDSQTEHITSDTGVEFTPKLTQYCFVFFFPSINLYFFFYSSCWPIIHLCGRRGPSKSHLFSWEGRRRFQLKFTICAWPSSSTFIF